ncbi:MAG: hypothetical protein ACLFM1_00415, partial [Bacteroidales bacterium]
WLVLQVNIFLPLPGEPSGSGFPSKASLSDRWRRQVLVCFHVMVEMHNIGFLIIRLPDYPSSHKYNACNSYYQEGITYIFPLHGMKWLKQKTQDGYINKIPGRMGSFFKEVSL